MSAVRPLVSICIPTLDNLDRLHRCMKSIRETCSHIDHEIVVCDNGDRPRGYVPAVNQALRAAKGEYRVAFNDDIVCKRGWLDALLNAAVARPEHLVVFPDQTSTDGEQCICGWCLMFTPAGWRALGGFDDRYTVWASDIDLAQQCNVLLPRPLRVPIPTPLEHDLTVTIGRDDFHWYMSPTGMADIEKYREKWGRDCLADKTLLKADRYDR